MAVAPQLHAEENHFALHIHQTKFGLQSTDSEFELDSGVFDIRFGEYLDPRLRLDVILGHRGVTTDNHSPTTGLQLEGNYGGLDLNGSFYGEGRSSFHYSLKYLYNDIDFESETQNSSFVWHEFSAEARAQLRIFGNTSVYACARYVDINGEFLQNGLINSDSNFDEKTPLRQCAGLYFESGIDGYVGVELEQGDNLGGGVYFGRFLDY